ncbi:lactosylceramide 4-alpha-galactosyltransferase [Anopheles gambiae]|uniref:lactosylceramide 4-alpha-galactosyltransferase n=1 Tax=Anopheles gambiae TaxID=7165 RepID=UPI002AC8D292|nr:lactosylceramide 4-alpha-galactosyltransferase [Anopheles gambiae]
MIRLLRLFSVNTCKMFSRRKCRFVLCTVGTLVFLLIFRLIWDNSSTYTPHMYSEIVNEVSEFRQGSGYFSYSCIKLKPIIGITRPSPTPTSSPIRSSTYDAQHSTAKDLYQQASESFKTPSPASTTPSPWIDTCFKIFDLNATTENGIHEKNILEDVQQSMPQPTDDGRNIFFHETSCWKDGIVRLNARQACAIESAARANPEWNVYVLFAAPVGFRNRTTQPILDALLEYRNVHLRYVNLTTYANDTPLKEWMAKGDILQSQYMNSHLSDVMRYLTLYKYGGTYLDLDVIVQQSFEKLEPNYAGAESFDLINSAVMNLESKGHGHELAETCVRDLLTNFNGNDWVNNGPGVITRVLQEHCRTQSIAEMTRHCSRHFTVYPSSVFYAIEYWNYELLFEEQCLEEALVAFNRSIVVHLWNKLSKDSPVRVGSRVAYGVLAERHCPKVYGSCGPVF